MKYPRRSRPFFLALILLLGSIPLGAAGTGEASGDAGDPAGIAGPEAGDRPELDLIGLPLTFESNTGQTDPRVDFLSRGDGYALFLTSTEAVLRLLRSTSPSAEGPGPRRGGAMRMRLVGADPEARAIALEPQEGKVHYLVGADPGKWRTHVPLSSRVRYRGVYPGIDVEYYGNQRRLEYDFIVAPGADPRAIELQFDGANEMRIDAAGDLVLAAGEDEIRFQRPWVYQETAGVRTEVDGEFARRADNRVGFELGDYDKEKPLIIDPVLSYSTYLGGWDWEAAFGIGADADAPYVTGYTFSNDFPTTMGAWDEICGDDGTCGDNDVFVTKIRIDQPTLWYSTFLGGSSGDTGWDVAVDAAGRAYVGGHTRSDDFPTTTGAFQEDYGGGEDSFVAVLTPTGDGLVYATYLGGSDNDGTKSRLALGPSNIACVSGVTRSANFPTTAGAYDTTLGGIKDVYVACLNSDGSALTLGTFIGGSGVENFGGMDVDSSGNVYVNGQTFSSDFTTTAGAYDRTLGGTFDDFLVKLNPSGTTLVYSTLIGGSLGERPNGVAVDLAGNAYVTGETYSSDFETTPGAFDTTSGGGFVVKLNPAGSGLVYSTFVDGARPEAIDVDSSGRAAITGVATAPLPTTPDAVATTVTGNQDAFLTTLNPDGTALVYSTFLGGVQESLYDNAEWGYDVAFDPAGDVYLSGVTDTSDFPTTPWAFAPELNWSGQGFVVKISGIGEAGEADLSIIKTDSPDPAPLYGTLTYTITVTNDGPDNANAVAVTDTLPPNVVYNESYGGDGWFCEGSWGDSLLVCSRALIAAGTTAPALTIDVNVDSAGGPFTNTASVVAAENDPVTSNNTATAETLADVDDCANNDGDDYVECLSYCNPPADKLCGDCNDWNADSYPGAPEICDYDDNDCNGETDEGMGPEGYVLLLMTANDSLSWSTVAGADAYDVIRGDLNAMRTGSGNFSTSECREDDTAGTTHLDTQVPVLGEGKYYLIRGVDTSNGFCGGGSWDSGGAWQSVSRDPVLGSWPCS